MFSTHSAFFVFKSRKEVGMNHIDESKGFQRTRISTGRKQITSGEAEINSSNVVRALQKAMAIHQSNSSDIDYLYRYYKGEQPILKRVKIVRPEICNIIVENIANEIASFWTGYLCGEPIQYVSRSSETQISEGINILNEFMFAEDKAGKDQELAEWFLICGTAYRLILPDSGNVVDDSPFEIYTLDPRNTFVVYSQEIGSKKLMSVKYRKDDDGIFWYSVYTDTEYFLIKDEKIVQHEAHLLSTNPINEYPANSARLGIFEIVLTLLDAINNLQSNRIDGVEQMVQAFIKFINCDIDEKELIRFMELGAIKVRSTDNQRADVDVVTTELDQLQSQTLKDDLYQRVLTICGMPNRNGGLSTSDTGSAVMLRDGWTSAETRAKSMENVFKRSEKETLKLVLHICRELKGMNLRLKDIDMKFTRRNYENIQTKSQVLISMLNNPKIHPQLAFLHSGLFTDAESAYSMSMEYYEQNKQELESNQQPEQTNISEDQTQQSQ